MGMSGCKVVFTYGFVAALMGLAMNVSPAHAATEFQCTINGVNANTEPVNVGRTTCSATVVYVNLDTGEQQELLRSCRIRKNKSSCTANYDDTEVTVGYPVISGIGGYSQAAFIYKFARRGCIQRLGDLATDADDFGNQTVVVNQNMVCKS